MTGLSATVARLGPSPLRVDLALAIALTIAGELEVLLGGADGSLVVSALALPLVTLALALRRRHPLAVAAAMTAVLVAQAAVDGFLVGHSVVPILALVVALYSVGRHARDDDRGLAAAAAVVAAIVATRIAFDPSVERWTDAVPTLVYVPLPLLVGRWVRGQLALRRELEAKIEQLDRERERGARQAAEDERVRITGDLQEIVASGLAGIIERARTLPPLLRSGGDHAAAPATFASIAATARDVLDDVRRVLGILRREGDAPQLAPPAAPGAVAERSADAAARSGGRRRGRTRRRPGVRPGGAPTRAGSTGCSSRPCSPAPRSSSPSRRPATSA